MTKGKFYGVGIGPGDPELMTLKAVRIITACPVIAAPQTAGGGTLALDIVSQAVNLEDKEILPLFSSMSRDREVLAKHHRAAADQIIERLTAGQDVVMLNLGDVSLYATYNYIRALVEGDGYETEMISGIPAFVAVAAALDENLTPEMNTPVHIIPGSAGDLEEVLDLPGTKIIMKAGRPLPKVKELLKTKGLYEKASLVQNCGLPDEVVAESLDEAEENNGYFTTMVVKP